MTVTLTGRDLTRDEVVRVARRDEAVELDRDAVARMQAGRDIVERALAAGDPVYGLSTAVGVLKRVGVDADSASSYSERMVRHHLVGQGAAAPRDVVRATMLRLANAYARGETGARPVLAQRLVAALNDGLAPAIRRLGSVGQADLAPMADLAGALFMDTPLAAGEGLALVSSNAFSTAWSALAVADATALVETLESAGALSLEGLGANLTLLHPAIGEARPYPGLVRALERLNELLADSDLRRPGAARSLQDPLTFRNLPQVSGACRDVLEQVDRQLAIELNASQSNPIVVAAEGRVVSVANFEILPLVVAVDTLRAVLASALAASSERTVKLLDRPWSGLPTGLIPADGDAADAGLSYLGIAVQALAAEARLLAAPVSFELVSTSHAEGIEDRTTMAPLAARRLAEQVELGDRIAALELTVAAQARELRGLLPTGSGTGRVAHLVRSRIPFLAAGDTVSDVEPLVELVRGGAFADRDAAKPGPTAAR